MKRATIDDLINMSSNGHLHLWYLVQDTRLPTMVRLMPEVPVYGQLEACRYSHAKDAYWCRYKFDGIVIRDYLERRDWPEKATGWYYQEPLAAGARARW